MALSYKSNLYTRNKDYTKPVLHLCTGKLSLEGMFLFPLENRVCRLATASLAFLLYFSGVLKLKYTQLGLSQAPKKCVSHHIKSGCDP